MASPTPIPRIRSTRRTIALTLMCAQVLAAGAAWVGNWNATDSIVVTGPLLTILGLAMSIVTRPWSSWAALLFGLSAPAVCALGAFIIAGFRLGPGPAFGPVLALLSLYLLGLVPAAIYVFNHLLSHPPSPTIRWPVPWRYSLKTLLGLMTAVAILTAFLASAIELLLRDFPINFALFGSGAIAASCGVAWRFVAERRKLA